MNTVIGRILHKECPMASHHWLEYKTIEKITEREMNSQVIIIQTMTHESN